jgi:hypothetical protein
MVVASCWDDWVGSPDFSFGGVETGGQGGQGVAGLGDVLDQFARLERGAGRDGGELCCGGGEMFLVMAANQAAGRVFRAQ